MVVGWMEMELQSSGALVQSLTSRRFVPNTVAESDITRGGPSGAEAAIQARPILLPMQK